MRNRNNGMKKGVTLIELSIVLIIIGLLIGIAFKGFDLVKGSSVTAEASKIQKITGAVVTFKSIYKRLPGDGCDAEDVLGTLCTGSADGSIGDANEAAGLWLELYTAGLINEQDRASEISDEDYGVAYADITGAHKGVYLTLASVPEAMLCELDRKYGDGVPDASKQDSGFMSTGTTVGNYTATSDCQGETGNVEAQFLIYKK